MTNRIIRSIVVVVAVVGGAAGASAQQSTREEMEALRRLVEQQAEAIRALTARVNELEGTKKPPARSTVATPPPTPVAPPAPEPVIATPGAAPSPAEEAEAEIAQASGRQSPVEDRGNFDDRQEAAARPGDFTWSCPGRANT